MGWVLVILGALVFIACVGYGLVNHARTGEVFKQHKRVLLPLMVASWLSFAAGAVVLAR